jgi:lipopolysaccharide export system permease protein
MNIVAAVIIPAGLFFYCRMWRFRLRLYRDIKIIYQTNRQVIERSEVLAEKRKK